MTPTTSEREARELLAQIYDEQGSDIQAMHVREGRLDSTDRFAERCIIAALTRPEAQQEAQMLDAMVSRFLGWKLPADFAPDCGITFDPIGNKGTKWEYRFEPVGTNLLTAVQARAMLEYVLAAGAPTAQQPLDGPANNAGVAAGSRNGPPSESVTRGNLPPASSQPEALGELPEPSRIVVDWLDADHRIVNLYTADQMRAYALASRPRMDEALLSDLDDYLDGCPDPSAVPKWFVNASSRLLWRCRAALNAALGEQHG